MNECLDTFMGRSNNENLVDVADMGYLDGETKELLLNYLKMQTKNSVIGAMESPTSFNNRQLEIFVQLIAFCIHAINHHLYPNVLASLGPSTAIESFHSQDHHSKLDVDRLLGLIYEGKLISNQFNQDQAKFLKTFAQHHKLFSYSFSNPRLVSTQHFSRTIEIPPSESLNSSKLGMSSDQYSVLNELKLKEETGLIAAANIKKIDSAIQASNEKIQARLVKAKTDAIQNLRCMGVETLLFQPTYNSLFEVGDINQKLLLPPIELKRDKSQKLQKKGPEKKVAEKKSEKVDISKVEKNKDKAKIDKSKFLDNADCTIKYGLLKCPPKYSSLPVFEWKSPKIAEILIRGPKIILAPEELLTKHQLDLQLDIGIGNTLCDFKERANALIEANTLEWHKRLDEALQLKSDHDEHLKNVIAVANLEGEPQKISDKKSTKV